MKVYIGTDMEGVNGVVTREHTHRDGREHDRARVWLTEEVNAAVAGALDAGATEIVVEDGHGTCRNILPDLLHPRARLITGQVTSLPPSMVHGLDGSFDAVMFIGYHARAGTPNANLDHTSWSQTVRHVRVNGQEVGETSIMSAYAGYHGVPTVCVSGDDKLGLEMDELQPEVEQAIVKQALGRYVCEMLPIEEGRALIREKARRGIERRAEIKPFAFDAPRHPRTRIPAPALRRPRRPGAHLRADRRRDGGSHLVRLPDPVQHLRRDVRDLRDRPAGERALITAFGVRRPAFGSSYSRLMAHVSRPWSFP